MRSAGLFYGRKPMQNIFRYLFDIHKTIQILMTVMAEKEEITIGVRMTTDLHAAAVATAESEHRTLSSWVRVLIMAAVEKAAESEVAK